MSRIFWSLWKAQSVGLDQDPVVGGVLRRLAGVRWAGAAGTFPMRRSCWLSPEEREEGWERSEAWVEGGWVGPMSAAAGRGGRVIVGRKGQKIKGDHGLVAVAARVRQTDGQTWKGNKKGT